MKHFMDSCDFNSPSFTYFSRDHTWIRKNEYGLIKIGIDEVTVKLLEEISVNGIVNAGTHLMTEDFIFEITSGQKKIPIGSPVTGTLKFINPFLCGGKISNPYKDDWIVLIQPENFIKDKKSLMKNEEYKQYIISEIKKLGPDFESEFLLTKSRPMHSELEGNI